MKNAFTTGLFLLAMLLILVSQAACSDSDVPKEAPSESTCSAIIDVKCVKCHYKTRICDALGTKSARNWKRTVKFMIKQGAQLTEDEQGRVIACLSSLPAGSDIVCK
jgi:hypothetical protein